MKKKQEEKQEKKYLTTDQIVFRFRVIAITTIMSIIGLCVGTTSCVKKFEEEKPTNATIEKDIENEIAGNVEPGSVKTFDAGEHILSVRVQYGYINNNDLTGYAVNNIPEGYELFQITSYTAFDNRYYSGPTDGYDIWFKNTEKVEVEASYNEVLKQYGYYTFGKVVEKEKVLEK